MDDAAIARSLERISSQIFEKNPNIKKLAIVGIRERGDDLAKRVLKLIETHCNEKPAFGQVDITLYRDDFRELTDIPVTKGSEFRFNPKDMVIILVDDVLYTGRTVRSAIDVILDFGRPRSIQLAVLIDRGGRELPICPDYVGMSVQLRVDEYVRVLTAETDGMDRVLLRLRKK